MSAHVANFLEAKRKEIMVLYCIVLHGIVLHLIICHGIALYCIDYTVLCSQFGAPANYRVVHLVILVSVGGGMARLMSKIWPGEEFTPTCKHTHNQCGSTAKG